MDNDKTVSPTLERMGEGYGNSNWNVYTFHDNGTTKILLEPVVDIELAHLSEKGNVVYSATGRQGFVIGNTSQGDPVKVLATVMAKPTNGNDYRLQKREKTESDKPDTSNLAQVGNA